MSDSELKRYITSEDMTIVDALDRINTNSGATLYVVDDEIVLRGSLSDGDVRRWIIKTGRIDAKVKDVMRSEVRTLKKGDESLAVLFLREHSITSVPIIDENRRIVDIVTSHNYKRYASDKSKSLSEVPVIVMAGGKGTRLYPYTKILPKPLIPINGTPILERIFDRFSEYGVNEFYLTVNYRKEMIKSYFNDVDHKYILNYIEENEPLGTAGSLRLIDREFHTPVIVTNCDILIDAEYDKIVEQHRRSEADMTVVSSLKNTIVPYGVLHIEEDGVIKSIDEKPTYSNLISTGMYVINPEMLSLIPKGTYYHMTDFMNLLMMENKTTVTFPISESSFLDMGEFEEMKRMEERICAD